MNGSGAPRPGELVADEGREQPADHEHEERVEEVLLADDLVVEREDVLAPEGGRRRVDSGVMDLERLGDRAQELPPFSAAFSGAAAGCCSAAWAAACSASHFW